MNFSVHGGGARLSGRAIPADIWFPLQRAVAKTALCVSVLCGGGGIDPRFPFGTPAFSGHQGRVGFFGRIHRWLCRPSNTISPLGSSVARTERQEIRLIFLAVNFVDGTKVVGGLLLLFFSPVGYQVLNLASSYFEGGCHDGMASFERSKPCRWGIPLDSLSFHVQFLTLNPSFSVLVNYFSDDNQPPVKTTALGI